jgi:cell division septation protein DedD
MTRTENEQELVLGNKQLLSAFFVVVALLGVFFTMGYMIGRSTGPAANKDAKDASANASPPPDTASHAIAPEPSAPAPVETADTAPAPVKKPAPKVEEPATETTAAVPIQSVPGHQYLQVMAVKRPEADKMVALLRKRGLPAIIGESSKPELYRVLVGPFSDTPSLAKTKTALKDLGFESVVSK